jgi:hypothetical protein
LPTARRIDSFPDQEYILYKLVVRHSLSGDTREAFFTYGKRRNFRETEEVRIIILVVLASVVTACAVAQQTAKEELEREKKFQEEAEKAKTDSVKKYGWTHRITTGLNLTEVAFSDWAEGGTNVFAYTPWLNGSSRLDLRGADWSTSYKFAFGQARVGSQGIRKTDDEIYMETLLLLKLDPYVNPYVVATVRTQFALGYKYDNAGNATAISRFFDPGYLTQSAGVAYQPLPELKTGLGLAVKETFTSRFNQYADDPRTPQIEKTKVEGGLRLVAHVDWKFAPSAALVLNQELFSPFGNLDQVFVRSDNSVVMEFSRYISLNFNVLLVHDVTVSRRTQIKQVLAVGVSYVLL